VITGYDKEPDSGTTAYPERESDFSENNTVCSGMRFSPYCIRDIGLQGVNQADEANDDELRIESVDELVKAFLVGVDIRGKEVTCDNAPCKNQHAATLGSPLLLGCNDALAGGIGKIQGSIASRPDDGGTAREENVRGTFDAQQKIAWRERIPGRQWRGKGS